MKLEVKAILQRYSTDLIGQLKSFEVHLEVNIMADSLAFIFTDGMIKTNGPVHMIKMSNGKKVKVILKQYNPEEYQRLYEAGYDRGFSADGELIARHGGGKTVFLGWGLSSSGKPSQSIYRIVGETLDERHSDYLTTD